MQNLVGIDSAVTDLCMRENTLFGEFFNEHIYLSVSSSRPQVTVSVVTLILFPNKGVKYPENPNFGGRA